MKNQNVFFDVVKGMGEKNKYEKFMDEAHENYDLRPYKIQKITPALARKIYASINSRYEKGEHEVAPIAWHENQRRLFVWFAVCYEYAHKVRLLDLTEDIWRKFSKAFHSKDPVFLEFQYRNLLKTRGRDKWGEEQDALLRKAVQKQKVGRWNEISKQVFFQSEKKIFRTPKQCRERWFNHLDNTKTKTEWTPSEDLKILKYVIDNDTKWAKMVSLLDGKRTEHSIKNRFHSLTNNSHKGSFKTDKQVTNRNKSIQDAILQCQKAMKKGEESEIADQNVKEEDQHELRDPKENHLAKKLSQVIEFDQVNNDRKFAGSPMAPFILETKSPESFLGSPFPLLKGLYTPGGLFFQNQQFDSAAAKWPTAADEDKGINTSQEYLKLPNSQMSVQYTKLTLQEGILKRLSSLEEQRPAKLLKERSLLKPLSMELEYSSLVNSKTISQCKEQHN